MASGPKTSWQIDGETMETVTDFIFLGCKITADDDHSHEIIRFLLLGRKAMTKLGCVLKCRDITLPTKVCVVTLWFFHQSCMGVRVGPQRRLSTEELMLLNCGVGEDSWESSGQHEIKPLNSKGKQSRLFIGRTDAETAVTIL